MLNKSHNRKYGNVGEMMARAYLRLHAARIIARNYSCPFGELDIVAQFEGRICFVEVKRRSSRNYGSPAQAVDRRKAQRIVKCAMYFLKSRGMTGSPMRFDVVQIDKFKIKYIRGAFTCDV
ncbi:MAG: YraN family protein [Clostridia bacterium]|nr:YraN family protein [Clostridia bacterium]